MPCSWRSRLAWLALAVTVFGAPVVVWPGLLPDPFGPTKELWVRGGIAVATVAWILGDRPGYAAGIMPYTGMTLALAVAPVIFSEVFERSLDAWLGLLGFVVAVAAGSGVMRGWRRHALLAGLAAVGGLSGAYAVGQYLGLDPVFVAAPWASGATIAGARPSRALAGALMGNPMLLGNYLAAVAPASWSLLVSVRSWAGSAGAWASAVLIVAGLAATESRSGMAGCLLAGGVWLWLLRRKPSPGAATPAAVGVLTLLLGILIAAGLSGRWKDVVDPDRLAMWTAAWQMALDAPWVGAGPGAYGLRFPYWAHAHSDVLELLADTGLAGGAALMVAVWWASWSCRSAWRSLPEARGIIAACGAGLVALIVSSFGSFPFHHPATAMAAAAYLAMLASFRPCLSAPIHPWLAGALVAGVVGSACIAAAKLGAAAAVSRLVYGFTP